jgi:H+/Cl- antiporter ClcA
MRTRLTEGTVLFISVLKWFVLATVIGCVVGATTAVFIKALNWSIGFGSGYGLYFLFLPLALFMSALIVKYLAPEAEGHGTEKVIEAVHKNFGKIRAMVVPVKILATLVTFLGGGSAGKEGPCAQIGAGLASVFADLLKFDKNDRRKLVICGISAGFASVFGTPIAGAIFGVEVLFVGGLLYDILLPSFVAGITAFQISSSLGITYFHHNLNFVPVFSEAFFIKVALAGVFFGLCSFMMVELMRFTDGLAARLKLWAPLKGLIGGAALTGLTLIFSTRYLGLGLDTIEQTLNGGQIAWYAFLVKALFTSITLSFGGSGGIITPIFFVGATSGAWFAEVLGLNIATFSGIGFVSLLAGAANTPISASIMATELFGPKVAPYAAVACVISFLMTGHRSVYPSQVLSVKKSSSFSFDLGGEIETVHAEFHSREKSLIGRLLKLWHKVRGGS